MEYKGLIVAVVDTKNTNGRIYSMDMMKKAIAEYSEKVNQKRAFGGIGMGAMISRLESQVEYKEEIYALLRKAKVSRWNIVEKAIVSSLAYDRVKKKFKYGNERKIYTKLMESLRDRQVTVVSKKTAKTGIYYPPYHGNGYDDYDGEPGGLTDGKTHILLEIDVFDEEGRIWIEQTNVVKL